MAGQIIKRGPSTWLVRVYMGRDSNGKRDYHNKTIHGNKKDAEQYLNKTLRERDLGTYIKPSKDTLTEFLDSWLEKVVKHRVREGTYLDYQNRLKWYVIPVLGDTRLSQVTPEAIQDIYNRMLEDGLSPRSVKYVHTVLKNALQQAVKWGKLYQNPAELVDLPRQKKEEMKVLTPKQAAAFMEATVYSPWKAYFSLLLASGMRPSEALGLKWNDINFNSKKVVVNRTLTRTKGGGWKLEEPKTARSRRTIPLPETVIKDLEEHKKNQAAEELKAKPGTYVNHDFVFTGKAGGPPDYRNIYDRHFKPLLEAANLPDIRLYDLRHTCATLLLSAGVNAKIVSERLGHASITLTLDTYSHVLPDMQAAAADKLENILFNNK